MKTFLFRSMIGIFFGAFLTVMISYIVVFTSDTSALDGEIFVKNSLGSMLCGWLFSVSPLYFEVERWKLSQQTALHFVTVIVFYFIIAFWIGWIPMNAPSILIGVGIFLLLYLVIWTGFYLYFKRVARTLNEELKNL